MDEFKIISGGQTGVDRAALDVAITRGIPHGGWCPKGRIAEDGRIEDYYKLVETESEGYIQRTAMNVIDSDATLIIYYEKLSGGTLLTREIAKKENKPYLTVELNKKTTQVKVDKALKWLCIQKPQILNIAGPRASSRPEFYSVAKMFIDRVIESYILNS